MTDTQVLAEIDRLIEVLAQMQPNKTGTIMLVLDRVEERLAALREASLLLRRAAESEEKHYVLIIKSGWQVFGPLSHDDAEYAAQAHYGTAITGASAGGEFVIAALRGVDASAIARQHDAHLTALLTRDD